VHKKLSGLEENMFHFLTVLMNVTDRITVSYIMKVIRLVFVISSVIRI